MVDRNAAKLVAVLKRHNLRVVTAESCTAGLLAKILSDAPGAAEHFAGGFVTYTKAQKVAALAIPSALIREHGAVHRRVAEKMAEGALKRSAADCVIAITGVAGPEPDEDGNPVGRMIVAYGRRGDVRIFARRYRNLGRHRLRRKIIGTALELLRKNVLGGRVRKNNSKRLDKVSRARSIP